MPHARAEVLYEGDGLRVSVYRGRLYVVHDGDTVVVVTPVVQVTGYRLD